MRLMTLPCKAEHSIYDFEYKQTRMQKRLRREVLGTLSVVAGFMLAGCSSDGGDSDDTGDDGDSSGDDGGEGDDTGDDGDGSGNDGGEGASLDLNLTVGELPDAFESLTVEFSGFSLFTATGSTIERESDPVQADLTALAASGDVMDLTEASVPADRYDNIRMFIAVTEATVSDDDSEQTFRSGEDGEVLNDFSDPDFLEIASGDAVTVTSDISVEDAFDYDWKFQVSSSFDSGS